MADLESKLKAVQSKMQMYRDEVIRLASESARLKEELEDIRKTDRMAAIQSDVVEALKEAPSKERVVRLVKLFLKVLQEHHRREFSHDIKTGTRFICNGCGGLVSFRVDYSGNVFMGKTSKRVLVNLLRDPPGEWTKCLKCVI